MPKLHVEMREIAARPVIGIRRRVARAEVGDFIRETFETVGPYFNSKGMEMTGPPVAIFFETTENELDMAAGAPVKEVTETTGDITELELAGGKVASAVYTGSYDGIPDAWAEFMNELQRLGETIVEPCWEEYLTDPSQESDESKWQTLLVQPIK